MSDQRGQQAAHVEGSHFKAYNAYFLAYIFAPMLLMVQGPAALEGNARAVLQVVPLSAFDSPPPLVDLRSEQADRSLRPPSGGGSPRYNFDGLVSEGRYPGRGVGSYAQLFRTGAVEAVDANPFDEQYGRVIAIHELEERTVEALKRYLGLQRDLGVSSPVVVMLGLVGVRGYEMPGGSSRYIRPVDRDDLVVPEALLEAGPESDDGKVGRALKRMFDALWNACGYAESPNFSDDGRWARYARGW